MGGKGKVTFEICKNIYDLSITKVQRTFGQYEEKDDNDTFGIDKIEYVQYANIYIFWELVEGK